MNAREEAFCFVQENEIAAALRYAVSRCVVVVHVFRRAFALFGVSPLGGAPPFDRAPLTAARSPPNWSQHNDLNGAACDITRTLRQNAECHTERRSGEMAAVTANRMEVKCDHNKAHVSNSRSGSKVPRSGEYFTLWKTDIDERGRRG